MICKGIRHVRSRYLPKLRPTLFGILIKSRIFESTADLMVYVCEAACKR